MLQVGETQEWKGAGLFAYSEGMPAVLQHNANTDAGLVNGPLGTAEGIVVGAKRLGSLVSLHPLSSYANILSSIL